MSYEALETQNKVVQKNIAVHNTVQETPGTNAILSRQEIVPFREINAGNYL